MNIHVGSGIGMGLTKMAAFDAALQEVGIANYNQILLSSIIPPKARVIASKGKVRTQMPGTWGDRLYVVMAEKRVDVRGKHAWAGVGWAQDEKTGKGLFTEHVGESEDFVKWEINQTLDALTESRNLKCGPFQSIVVGVECREMPVCAMVAAVYQVSTWDNEPDFFELPYESLKRLEMSVL